VEKRITELERDMGRGRLREFMTTALGTLLALAGCVNSDAQVEERATTEERARDISRILSDYAFDSPIVSEENAATCQAVINALRDGAGMTFVEPVLISDDPEHPRLAAYRDTCRDFDDWPPGVANSEFAFRTLTDVGDRHFELYELDRRSADERPRNDLLYAETTLEHQALGMPGGFVSVDLKRCVKEAILARPQSDLAVKSAASSVVQVNALTLFDDEYYVITVHDLLYQFRTDPAQQPIYALDIWRLRANGPFDSICGIQAPVDPN
jgi:hypothetical protein